MKTYEEMAQSALDRIGNYEINRNKRRKTVTKILLPAASFCFAAVLGICIWRFGWFQTKPAITSSDIADPPIASKGDATVDNSDKGETTQDHNPSAKGNVTVDNSDKGETTQDHNSSAKGNVTVDNSDKGVAVQGTCYFWWKNKLNVGGELYNAIQNDTGEAFSVIAAYRPTTADITSFRYEGKTLAELAVEADEERIYPEKMTELLKLGEDLKYGTALYETGTPSGVKWDKRLYEEKISFLGEELLNKYIVNGEFLREKLEKDIAEYHEDSANRKYKSAYHAYLETVLPPAVKLLNEHNIPCERTKYSTNCITMLVTVKELDNLPLKDLKSWYFELASDYKNKSY